MSASEPPEGADHFQLEVDWCIARLEERLETCPSGSRNAVEAEKVLRILTSSKAPLVKKRQAMRSTFGDYRKKIRDMEKKTAAAMKKTQFLQGKAQPQSSRFLRHSKASAHHRRLTSSSDSSADSSFSGVYQEQAELNVSTSSNGVTQMLNPFVYTTTSTVNSTVNSTSGCLHKGVNGERTSLSAQTDAADGNFCRTNQACSLDKSAVTAHTDDSLTADDSRVSSQMDGLKLSDHGAPLGDRFMFRPSQNEFRFDFGAEKLSSADDDIPSSYVMRPSGNAFQFNFTPENSDGT